MSLPNTERELLLSTALDGELTADEQAAFDSELAIDPALADELRELRSLRSDLRLSFASLTNQPLSGDAAARIMAAVNATHHEQQTSQLNRLPLVPHRSAKWAVVVTALAASVAFVVAIGNRDQNKPLDGVNALAIVPVETAPKDDIERKADQQQASSPGTDAIASLTPLLVEPKRDAVAPPRTMGMKGVASDAAVAANVRAPIPLNAKLADDRSPLNVVLVVSVELTNAGREQLALQEALRATDIRLSENSVMGSEVVSHLQDANIIDTATLDGNAVAKLFLVEASAKRIDHLMSYLMSDPQSFGTVGLSLATQPPLLASVGDLRDIDPTKVRQSQPISVARGIVAADQRSISIDPSYVFIPLSREMVDAGLMNAAAPANSVSASAGNADDFPSQLLLLVK